jgi:hypothetical protein
MADRFVNSAAGGAGTGADWANAYASIAAAIAAPITAGDRVFVTNTHVEPTGAALTLTVPGTAAAPTQILCVVGTPATPGPSDLANAKGGSATVPRIQSTTTTTLTIAGSVHWEGFEFYGGETSSASGGSITLTSSSGRSVFKNCHFRIATTGGTGAIRGGGGVTTRTVLENCSVQFGGVLQSFGNSSGGLVEWKDTDTAFVGATLPNALIGGNNSGNIFLSNLDLSALNSGSKIYASGYSNGGIVVFSNCELGSSTIPKAGSITVPPTEFYFNNCHASGNYVHEKYTYYGSQIIETTIVRTGGASDGTTPIAWKIVTLSGAKVQSPYESLPIILWNDVEDVSRTVTVQGIWGGGSVPTNAEIWMEVEYPADASTPLGGRVSSGPATLLTTASNNAAASETWGGSTTDFSMSVAFTPLQKGPVRITIKAAKASETFYICPKAAIANT